MKIDSVTARRSRPTRTQEAQAAYEARTFAASGGEPEDDAGLGLRARSVDSDYGPTVLLSAPGERAGSPMALLSVALLRQLLTLARTTGPPRSGGGRPSRRRLDIRV
jgi:hypothetical protein